MKKFVMIMFVAILAIGSGCVNLASHTEEKSTYKIRIFTTSKVLAKVALVSDSPNCEVDKKRFIPLVGKPKREIHVVNKNGENVFIISMIFEIKKSDIAKNGGNILLEPLVYSAKGYTTLTEPGYPLRLDFLKKNARAKKSSGCDFVGKFAPRIELDKI